MFSARNEELQIGSKKLTAHIKPNTCGTWCRKETSGISQSRRKLWSNKKVYACILEIYTFVFIALILSLGDKAKPQTTINLFLFRRKL